MFDIILTPIHYIWAEYLLPINSLHFSFEAEWINKWDSQSLWTSIKWKGNPVTICVTNRDYNRYNDSY